MPFGGNAHRCVVEERLGRGQKARFCEAPKVAEGQKQSCFGRGEHFPSIAIDSVRIRSASGVERRGTALCTPGPDFRR
jgi:hypothetical protein